MEKYLGVDFGGTNVKVGLVGKRGGIRYKKKYPTSTLINGNDIVDGLLKVFNEEFGKHKTVQGIGIGIPGALTKDRQQIVEAPNVPQLNGLALKKILQQNFPDKRFYLENDANAAALGELYFSRKNIPDNFIFVTLGTGVGGAVILDRKIFTGGGGNAMEIGHIVSSAGMSIEQRIGKKGLVKLALRELENFHGESALIKKNPLTAKVIENLALNGDVLAQRIFQIAGLYLGEALATAIRLFDIETVVIGGGVADNFNLMKEQMDISLKKYLTPYYLGKLRIIKAGLENDAGIIGAASLCFTE